MPKLLVTYGTIFGVVWLVVGESGEGGIGGKEGGMECL